MPAFSLFTVLLSALPTLAQNPSVCLEAQQLLTEIQAKQSAYSVLSADQQQALDVLNRVVLQCRQQ